MDDKFHIDVIIFSCLPSAWNTRRMVVIPLSSGGMLDRRDANAPLERRVCRLTREKCCVQRVLSMGQKRMSPRLIHPGSARYLTG